mmetsp:Transcript_68824/g.113916  ORF Transcript_68824/g.113916 Transcript_68824/m.113916 type:complete len:452 (-) Transcript_68824:72-1427(-)
MCEGVGVFDDQPVDTMEALGPGLAGTHQPDDRGTCVVNNSYFRAWQCPPKQGAKLTIWCLARDGSVLMTQEPVRVSKPQKRKAPITLFVDETLIREGMSVEEIKQARLLGAKLWREVSPQEKACWTERAKEANSRVADSMLQHLAFKLVMQSSDTWIERAISMLRELDNISLSRFSGDGAGEPPIISIFRQVLQMGRLESSFQSREECICEYWDAMNLDFGACVQDYAACMACSHLGQNIFLVEFTHQLVMASTMLRLQEHYECPNAELRGRCFSLNEYKSWEREHNPQQGFTYYATWPGFNVPGSVVREALQEGDLLPREQALKQLLGEALSLPNFYLVGTLRGDTSTLYHEVCHAMFEVNTAYRSDVDSELATIQGKLMRSMKAHLVSDHYADVERILQDEVHAYLSEGDDLGCGSCKTAQHTRRLQAIFLNYAGDLCYLLHDASLASK